MSCKLCGNEVKEIEFGNSPIAGYKVIGLEKSLNEPSFKLVVNYCPNCNYSKYIEHKDAEDILIKLYETHGNTYMLSKHVLDYVDNLTHHLIDRLGLTADSKVLEIGCNDGSLLESFSKNIGCKVYGVEPSTSFHQIWRERNLNVINGFFDDDIAEQVDHPFDVIIIRHVLEHISDVKSMVKNFAKLMNDHSTLIIEVPYFLTVLQNKRIENIGYSHLNYFTIRSMNEAIKDFGMGIESFDLEKTDGGSIIFYIKKGVETPEEIMDTVSYEDLVDFKKYIERRKDTVNLKLKKFKKNEIVGFGAGAKGQHLIHLLGLEDVLGCVVDSTVNDTSKYIPGTALNIVPETLLTDIDAKIVVNLAPTHTKILKGKTPSKMEFYNIIEIEDENC